MFLLSEALCGGNFEIKTLDDRSLFIEFSGIVTPNDKKSIKEEGMVNGGNLIIEFDVTFPTKQFTDDQKKDLMNILPKSDK